MTVNIEPRSVWGARHADGDRDLPNLATEVVVHHTASATLPATATVEQERAAMRALEQTGQTRFGRGISYRGALIFPSGRAYQGVSWNRRGTHVGGRNSTAVAIAFVGNFVNAAPTAAALATAAAIIHHGRGRWWTTTAPVQPHSHFTATACPGRAHSALMANPPQAAPAPAPIPAAPALTLAGLADQVQAGMWGNGPDRARRLTAAGHNAAAVQAEVNRRLTGRPAAAPAPAPARPVRTVAQMADEVIRGLHGTGHDARRRSLGVNAATYAAVRAEVNRRLARG